MDIIAGLRRRPSDGETVDEDRRRGWKAVAETERNLAATIVRMARSKLQVVRKCVDELLKQRRSLSRQGIAEEKDKCELTLLERERGDGVDSQVNLGLEDRVSVHDDV